MKSKESLKFSVHGLEKGNVERLQSDTSEEGLGLEHMIGTLEQNLEAHM